MDRLLTIDDLAEWLQVKPRTIYQWVHEGYIPVIKLGALGDFFLSFPAFAAIRAREPDARVTLVLATRRRFGCAVTVICVCAASP